MDLDNYERQMFLNSALTTMRIEDDGTYRNIYLSPDGLHFVLIHQVSNTDFLTADQIGFCADSESTTYPLSANLISWKEE